MIAGIDPGLAGAIAFLHRDRVARVRPMPTLALTKTKRTLDAVAIASLLSIRVRRGLTHVFIEKVSAMPGQGVTSMFNFGAGWGMLIGICAGLEIPYTLVHPATWKAVMCRDMPRDSKEVGIIVAKRLFPNVSLLPTPRSKKDNDGMADALLIAEYGRRSLIGG